MSHYGTLTWQWQWQHMKTPWFFILFSGNIIGRTSRRHRPMPLGDGSNTMVTMVTTVNWGDELCISDGCPVQWNAWKQLRSAAGGQLMIWRSVFFGHWMGMEIWAEKLSPVLGTAWDLTFLRFCIRNSETLNSVIIPWVFYWWIRAWSTSRSSGPRPIFSDKSDATATDSFFFSTLWWTNIAMERSTIFHGKIHYFDWAIFNSKLLVHWIPIKSHWITIKSTISTGPFSIANC